MAQPYVGEIRMFAGNFPPVGWSFCEGQLLSISENETLFQLIGTTYGGDGQETFALPNLQGRLPIHQGQGSGLSARQLAETGGVESVTLSAAQMPVHSHAFRASTGTANQTSPAGNVVAQPTAADLYLEDVATAALATGALQPAGGSQPHDNLHPYLCINHIISLFGIFPSPT